MPKLSLKDATQENSLSTLSSPVAPSGPLSPPLDPMGSDIGDLHDVPINDEAEPPSNITKSQSMEEVGSYCISHYFNLKIVKIVSNITSANNK